MQKSVRTYLPALPTPIEGFPPMIYLATHPVRRDGGAQAIHGLRQQTTSDVYLRSASAPLQKDYHVNTVAVLLVTDLSLGCAHGSLTVRER